MSSMNGQHKALYFTILLFLILALPGCNSKDSKATDGVPDINAVLCEFYNSSYDYTKMTYAERYENASDGSEDIIRTVHEYQGTVIDKPYMRSSILMGWSDGSGDDDSLDQSNYEQYYMKEGSAYVHMIVRGDQIDFQIQHVRPTKHYAQGEDLQFEYVGEEDVNGQPAYKFQTTIEERWGNEYIYKGVDWPYDFSYSVELIFWVDKLEHKIIKSYTDFTEMINQNRVFNNYTAHPDTFEPTPSSVIISTDEVYYYNQGNPSPINVPDAKLLESLTND